MKHNVYLTTAEPHSGKVILQLGLMEWLTRHGGCVALFRPIVDRAPAEDRYIHLARSRYRLEQPPEALYGCTLAEARDLLAADAARELLERILERFKALEEQCGGVLCVGTDFAFGVPALELDFNIEVARNLGTRLVLLGSGRGRSPRENAELLASLARGARKRGGEVLAAILNHVDPDSLDPLKQLLAGATDGAVLAALPEEPALEHPTVGDLTRAMGARRLIGCEEDLNRDIHGIKVAAMGIDNYLGHIEEGDLVITPGDRADILLGTMGAHLSSRYPQVSALLLSGGLTPAASVLGLLEGLQKIPVPVLQVESDTFDTAIGVSRVQPELHPDNPRKLAAALGLVESHLDLEAMLAPLEVSAGRERPMTPLMFEYELVRRAKLQRRHIVLPESGDDRILRAAEILLLREVAELTLLGEPHRVQGRAAELGLDLSAARVVDPLTSPWRNEFAATYYRLRRHKGISEQMALDLVGDVSYFGTLMVLQGYADGMVSGAAHSTQHTIRPAFEVIRTRPGAALVSSVFFMCLPDRVLVYGDCAINPEPDAEQLADIAIASADTAAAFGVEPRVALLSYSTGDSGKGEEVDKVREATRIARERRPDLLLEGPIQYDAAVDPGVAAKKLPGSRIAGNATVLIFPDLNTGNNTYKAVQRSSGAVAIGPVLQGLNKPVNDLSRGCTVTDIVNTVAITAIQAQQAGETQ
ncbi:MAG TPA: phosphate acetyltransferase [Sedimenticola sp.]|nr:phosphate acetyltransferase [Sedimenticola sp.]